MSTTEKKPHSYQITLRFLEEMDKIVGSRVNGKKITAKEFGEKVGINSTNLVRLRSNPKEHHVTVEAIGRLCKVYGTSPSMLILGVSEKNKMQEALDVRMAKMEATMKKIDAQFKAIKKGL